MCLLLKDWIVRPFWTRKGGAYVIFVNFGNRGVRGRNGGDSVIIERFDILLSLPKYMTELQFKVASLIPTLLPEGEGLLPPSPSGIPWRSPEYPFRGNEGEGRMCRELRKDQ